MMLCGLFLGISTVAMADSADNADNTAANKTPDPAAITLAVSPLTCVALHKKQVCYKTLDFRWSTLPTGRYCLHASDLDTALHCWSHSDPTRLLVDYASASEITYELRAEGRDDALASIVVKTSWVYRTGRRSASGWRLF